MLIALAVWGWYLVSAYLVVLAVDAAWAALQLARPQLNPAWADANLTEAQVTQSLAALCSSGVCILRSCCCLQELPLRTRVHLMQAALWGIPATAISPAAKNAGQQQQRQQAPMQQQQQQAQQRSGIVTPLVSFFVRLCSPRNLLHEHCACSLHDLTTWPHDSPAAACTQRTQRVPATPPSGGGIGHEQHTPPLQNGSAPGRLPSVHGSPYGGGHSPVVTTPEQLQRYLVSVMEGMRHIYCSLALCTWGQCSGCRTQK